MLSNPIHRLSARTEAPRIALTLWLTRHRTEAEDALLADFQETFLERTGIELDEGPLTVLVAELAAVESAHSHVELARLINEGLDRENADELLLLAIERETLHSGLGGGFAQALVRATGISVERLSEIARAAGIGVIAMTDTPPELCEVALEVEGHHLLFDVPDAPSNEPDVEPEPMPAGGATPPGGAWRGFLVYAHNPVPYAQAVSLSFDRGAVTGHGRDDRGEFTLVEGEFEPESGACLWQKTYGDEDRIHYEGWWLPSAGWIAGRWDLESTQGVFALRPDDGRPPPSPAGLSLEDAVRWVRWLCADFYVTASQYEGLAANDAAIDEGFQLHLAAVAHDEPHPVSLSAKDWGLTEGPDADVAARELTAQARRVWEFVAGCADKEALWNRVLDDITWRVAVEPADETDESSEETSSS